MTVSAGNIIRDCLWQLVVLYEKINQEIFEEKVGRW